MSLTWPPVQRVLFVSPHGVGSAGGFLAGASLLVREVRRRGDLDEQVVVRALTWAAVGAIVGARLDYLISHPHDFTGILDRLELWRGGLAMFGGFIGGVLAALPILIRAKVHLPRFLDAAAPGFALGVVIGRIGDLVIWDHLGDPAHGWWRHVGLLMKKGYHLAPGFESGPGQHVAQPLPHGLSCDAAAKTKDFYAGCVYHQPALYDFLGALALFAFLMWLRRRGRYRAGAAICVWGLWYGAERVGIDFTRSIDERFFGLTGTQWLALVLAATCAVLLVVIHRRGGEPSREGSLVHSSSSEDSADSIAPSA